MHIFREKSNLKDADKIPDVYTYEWELRGTAWIRLFRGAYVYKCNIYIQCSPYYERYLTLHSELNFIIYVKKI